ncbi:MAG: hypothetical protein JKY34_12455 [Kordiimonadaceae bacterium]|nr:hypothetical protein [Kordiimonadaceae bacterium]PCJ37755.1 MAG: hypothetical protein COA75_03270 [Cellvibrionales bacterium]
MQDFSFQGKVFLGERLSTGKPGAMRWVNDAALLSIKASQSEEKRSESYSGLRQTSATIAKALEVTFDLTLNHGEAKNLALGLYGEVNTIAGGSITEEPFPNPVAVGDVIALDRGNVSSLEVTDSLGTPATLTLDTDYALDDANYGRISMLDLAAYTQPFKAAYDYAGNTDITLFTQAPPVRYLIMDGFNTVDGSADLMRVRMYRLKFNPASQLDLINDSFGDLKLSGTALLDTTAVLDAALGGYGRMELLSE